MSFPCYHSAVAAYAAVYVIAYFHRVLQVRGTYTLRPIIATGLLILSLLPTYEHYITLKNDEFDIIVGFLCGIIISLYVVSISLAIIITLSTLNNNISRLYKKTNQIKFLHILMYGVLLEKRSVVI